MNNKERNILTQKRVYIQGWIDQAKQLEELLGCEVSYCFGPSFSVVMPGATRRESISKAVADAICLLVKPQRPTFEKSLKLGDEIIETETGRVLVLDTIDLVPNGMMDTSLVAVIKGRDEKGSIQATSNKFHVKRR